MIWLRAPSASLAGLEALARSGRGVSMGHRRGCRSGSEWTPILAPQGSRFDHSPEGYGPLRPGASGAYRAAGTFPVSADPCENLETSMIVLGIILLLIGWLAHISILVTIGVIVLVIGLVFMLLGATGRAVGGRKYWY